MNLKWKVKLWPSLFVKVFMSTCVHDFSQNKGGTTCDVSSGKCNRGDLAVVNWIEKVPAIITDVICPDGQSKCQTGQTCCKLATGDYCL
jgi:hypothetical protein